MFERSMVALLRLAGLVVLVAQSACSTLPEPVVAPAPEIPTHWQNTVVEPATDLSRWWLRFDDMLMARLISDALDANPGISSARAALRQARALRDVSNAALYPALNASLSASQTRTADLRSELYGTGLDASWEIDVFGANRSTLRAADAPPACRRRKLRPG